MKTYTIELSEAQVKMISTMWNNFDLNEFFKENPQIEEEESLTWYEDELHNLEAILCDFEQEIYYSSMRKK